MAHYVSENKDRIKTIICKNPECKKEFVEKIYSSQTYCQECRKEFILKKIIKCHFCENKFEVNNSTPNKQICSECKSKGIKFPKLRKKMICMYCENEFETFRNAIKSTPCPDCKETNKSIPKRIKKLKCIYCNKEFESYYNARVDTPCPDCKNKGHRSIIAQETGMQGLKQFKKMNNNKNPMQIKENVEKLDNTMMEKYGVKRILQREDFKDKVKKTNMEKYGYEYGLQVPSIREKGKETFIKNYGKDHWMKSDEGKQKISKILSDKFLPSRKELLEQLNIELNDFEYKHAHYYHNWKCLKCNNIFNTKFDNFKKGYLCPICYPRIIGTSIGEQLLYEFISKILPNEKIINNDRTIINPFELDVYVPNKKIAFEYNGLWYHSEKNGKDKDYHINKTNKCGEKGIRLIHIFEDEWIFKRKIVEERIKYILNIVENKQKIFARKCEIKEIDYKTKNDFLLKNHLQGADKSIIKLGAFYNNILVSIMTFSKGNISKGSKHIEGKWELNRFCSDSNCLVVGIAGKLLSYFKKNYVWNEIFSYADLRWSEGNVYFKLGFDLDYATKPNYWYIKDFKRFHRFSLRKKYDDPKNITEKLLRLSEGYQIIWDCGNLKFSMNNV